MANASGVDAAVEVGQITVEGEAAGGGARHRAAIRTGVVDQGVGDSGGLAVGDLPKRADVEFPVAVEVVLEMRAGGVGGVVVAGVILPQVAAGRVRRVRERHA